jgi:hypothetical protein
MNFVRKYPVLFAAVTAAVLLFGLVMQFPVKLQAQTPSGGCATNFGAPPPFIVTTSALFGCLIAPNSGASNPSWQQLWPALTANGGLGPDAMLSVGVVLTNTQVLGMFATPVTLVAAQGAGTLIEPISAVLENVNGGTAYAAGGVIELALNNAGTLTAASTTIAATFLTSPTVTQETLLTGALGSATATNTLNQPLVITNLTGAFTTGTGTLGVRLRYRIHTGL